MRLSQAWIVARHDLQLLRQRRGILVGLIALPIGIGLGFPALVQFLLLPRGGPHPATWAPMFIDAFAFWFVIGAASLPTSIASYSIVGEKVSKSLETLLSTPTTDGEILLGKTLAALIPTLLAMWIGALLFQVLIDLETIGSFGYLFYPNWQMAVELFVAMPLVALVAIEAAVVISARVTDVRSAQQYAGVIFVPMIFVYVAAEVVLPLTAMNLLYISAVFGLLALVLFWVSMRAFRREEILTRWK
jgi:ABC-2 type transport system permease protein